MTIQVYNLVKKLTYQFIPTIISVSILSPSIEVYKQLNQIPIGNYLSLCKY